MSDCLGLINHPLRASLSNEMHVRKLPPVVAPSRIAQVLVHCDNAEGARQHDRLLAQLDKVSNRSDKFIVGQLGDAQIVWERHSEFSSYMFILNDYATQEPFDDAPFAAYYKPLLAETSGSVVRATLLIASRRESPTVVGRYFSRDDLVVCDVAGGKARLWSDFRLQDDNFGRLFILDRGMNEHDAARVIQRLQELGNYRNMALLGLPVAQQLTHRVSEYEARLADLSASLPRGEASDQALLAQITSLSAEMAEVVAETRYRMSASQAYAQISVDCLSSLDIRRVDGFQTLDDFTERRLLPAVRTCASFSTRLEDLTRRLEWLSSLLRTRIDTELLAQNRDLLASMDRRTAMQFHLQQTVEGLSVVAISYYAIGLLSYVSHGLKPLVSAGLADNILAATVPVIAALTWLGLRRLHKRHRSAETQP